MSVDFSSLYNAQNLGRFTFTRAHNNGWVIENARGQVIAAFSTLEELIEAFPKMVGKD